MLTTKQIDSIFEILSATNPEPTTELKYVNEYTMLVAVVLSAQATDVGVNKATEKLFAEITSPSQMLDLGEEGLVEYIKSIGLYKAKARNIIALSQILTQEYAGTVPNNFEDLIKLPGVGRKTANVILNTAFGHPTIAVDTHIFRVSKRLGIASGNNPDKVADELVINIPSKWHRHAHHWLILHGRYICKARRPECERCPIREYCEYVKAREITTGE